MCIHHGLISCLPFFLYHPYSLYFTRHGHAGPVFCSPAIPRVINQITNGLVSYFRYDTKMYRETVSQFGFIKIEGQHLDCEGILFMCACFTMLSPSARRISEVDTLAEMITPTNLDP